MAYSIGSEGVNTAEHINDKYIGEDNIRKRANVKNQAKEEAMIQEQEQYELLRTPAEQDKTKKANLMHSTGQFKSKFISLLETSSPSFGRMEYVCVLIVVFALAFCTRWYKISAGNFVLWDEAHFGKFGAYYLKRTYYTDVHPPLAKLLVGLAEYLSEFDGEFKFDSGKPYPDNVNYVKMRSFLSAFGALVVPVIFSSAYHLGLSKCACYLVVGISRPILLDSTLLFFTALTCNFLVKFIKLRENAFTFKWIFYLFGTGVSIGLVASSKWVGLFSVALVGFYTIWDLIDIWSNRKNSIKKVTSHFLMRVLFLIVVPIAIYVGVFWIHFFILNRSGPGDAQMSSLFQASLKDSKIAHSPVNVVYGSSVAIKNQSYYGGLLHSHIQRYPVGSGQQQVTTYHHRDHNNYWLIEKALGRTDGELLESVRDGDLIRLLHVSTGANLHSHKIHSFLTTADYEVSCYGNEKITDQNDHWVIEFVDKSKSNLSHGLRTFFTSFRLRHKVTGCYLRYTTQHYPDWGFKQGEVSCVKDPFSKKEITWNVEENTNNKLEPGNSAAYKTNFFQDFMDLNVNMFKSNNSLTPDPEVNPSGLTSSPAQWPFLIKGIRMSSFDDGAVKFYMFANPIGGWMCLAALLVTVATFLYYFLINQRLGALFPKGCIGWALHYFPFFIMGRVLYFHHYYPAYLFAILNFAIVFDFYTKKYLSNGKKILITMAISTLIIFTFVFFAPICYGITGPISEFRGRKWLSLWL